MDPGRLHLGRSGLVAGVGQVDVKSRALVCGAVNAYLSTILPDDPVYGGQPQTGALTWVFGGEKGIEDLFDDLRGDARSGVGDFDQGVGARREVGARG